MEGDFAAGCIRDADAWDEWRADASGDGFDDPSVTLFHRKLEGVDVIDAVDYARDGGAGFEDSGYLAGVVRFRFGEFRVGLDDDHDGVGDTELRGDAEWEAANLGIFSDV